MSSAFASSADCASRMEAGSISSAHAAPISAQISASISRPRIPCFFKPLTPFRQINLFHYIAFFDEFQHISGNVAFSRSRKRARSADGRHTRLVNFSIVIRFGIGFALTASALRGRNQRFPSIFLRNCPVYDFSHAATSSGVPSQTISPPLSPPSGPRSIR